MTRPKEIAEAIELVRKRKPHGDCHADATLLGYIATLENRVAELEREAETVARFVEALISACAVSLYAASVLANYNLSGWRGALLFVGVTLACVGFVWAFVWAMKNA